MKAINPFLLLPFVVLMLLVGACDIINGPRRVVVKPVRCSDTLNEDRAVGKRRILLEDYTGYYCGNCPGAAKIASDLEDQYGNCLIVLAVHAGFFADPSIPGRKPYDYRTPEGTELDDFFGNSSAGNPNGLVLRRPWASAQRVISPTAWPSAVDSFLALPFVVDLGVTATWDAGSRNINIGTTTTFVQPGRTDDMLAVYIVEDSVIGFQEDYRLRPGPVDVEDYVHRHMLRGSVNGSAFGVVLSPTVAPAAGSVQVRNYSYTLPTSINAKNTYILAYVHRNDTKEVLQVSQVKLIP
jgi:thiol-disulfide isomerase/thioredoxin